MTQSRSAMAALPSGRLGAVDVVVAADQEYHPGADLPIALPERGAVPAELVERLAGLPGVASAVGDVGFPAALVDAEGRVVPNEAPETAGHGWSSTGLSADPRIDGAEPAGPDEIGLDRSLAAAAGVGPGDRVEVVAAGRPAAEYRVSAVVDAPEAGIFFAALAAGLVLSVVPPALLGMGFPDRPWPAGPVWLLPATALAVLATAFLTVEIPTRQALRTAPADALAHHE
ncbi:hypothetical protein [Streptomyces johnsoniae]|uniref:ABC transporter permease n=1 Tax=Streptomyces johnsoniae TaxID=3075532 RepID=A0ABU2S099_9ACTN|nr:hypothetical protein [Streptomyces sp. DSM 41886]MDT0442203.1 hypothetical protein [Streptomyces sp. DSM 41886]